MQKWWREQKKPNAGIAIHVGGSGGWSLTLSKPENVPLWLWRLLERAMFRRTTTDPANRRGHYFYRLRPGEMFSNGLGGLKLPNGKKWGEVKCSGGGLVLAPGPSAEAARAVTAGAEPTEAIPYRPNKIAAKRSGPRPAPVNMNC